MRQRCELTWMKNFNSRLLRRRDNIKWPASSPYLIAMDFCFWEIVKDIEGYVRNHKIYSIRKGSPKMRVTTSHQTWYKEEELSNVFQNYSKNASTPKAPTSNPWNKCWQFYSYVNIFTNKKYFMITFIV